MALWVIRAGSEGEYEHKFQQARSGREHGACSRRRRCRPTSRQPGRARCSTRSEVEASDEGRVYLHLGLFG